MEEELLLIRDLLPPRAADAITHRLQATNPTTPSTLRLVDADTLTTPHSPCSRLRHRSNSDRVRHRHLLLANPFAPSGPILAAQILDARGR